MFVSVDFANRATIAPLDQPATALTDVSDTPLRSARTAQPQMRCNYLQNIAGLYCCPDHMNAKRSTAGTYVAKRRWSAERRPAAVRKVLKESPNSTATISQITEILQEKEPTNSWTEIEVKSAIKWAQKKDSFAWKKQKKFGYST